MKFKWVVLATVYLLTTAISALQANPGHSADLAQISKSVAPKLKLQLESKGFQLGQNIFIRIFKETSEPAVT